MDWVKSKKKLIGAVSLTALLFAACENDLAEVQALGRKENVPAETGTNVELIYSDSGSVQMVLNTPYLQRFAGDSTYVELPKGVQVIFYDSLMQEESRLTADYAINREAKKIMEARRNVVVLNNKGERLNTEHLIWDLEEGKIYTDEFVKITTENEVIMGNGMEADQSFSRYKIFKVTANLMIDADDQSTENP